MEMSTRSSGKHGRPHKGVMTDHLIIAEAEDHLT